MMTSSADDTQNDIVHSTILSKNHVVQNIIASALIIYPDF
jgi:hypothetical protein